METYGICGTSLISFYPRLCRDRLQHARSACTCIIASPALRTRITTPMTLHRNRNSVQNLTCFTPHDLAHVHNNLRVSYRIISCNLITIR